jgi:hypothetical protein
MKFVPWLLTNDRKQQRVNVCRELQEKARISSIKTGDKSWIYGYDPKRKQQSSQQKSPQSPRAKKVQQVRSSTNSTLIVSFDVKGTVHHEFVPPNTTVNSEFYCDVLRRSRESVPPKKKKKRNFGATTTGSFITTTCPSTHPWKPLSLWLTTWLSFPIPPTHWLSPWFCFVSQTEGTTFWNSVWHAKGIASSNRQH